MFLVQWDLNWSDWSGRWEKSVWMSGLCDSDWVMFGDGDACFRNGVRVLCVFTKSEKRVKF